MAAVKNFMPHAVMNHNTACVDGSVHTNTIEGFWSLLKRAWYGSHHPYGIPQTKTRKLVVDKPTKGMPQRDVGDISILAGSSKERLGLVEGVPRMLDGAKDLWARAPYPFQKWAIEPVDGFATTKRIGDGGINGRLSFALPNTVKDLQSMAIEAKGGKNVGVAALRDLRGVSENGTALMAGLIVLEPLSDRKTQNFRREMAAAGGLEVLGVKYPPMQQLTVPAILGFSGRAAAACSALWRQTGDSRRARSQLFSPCRWNGWAALIA